LPGDRVAPIVRPLKWFSYPREKVSVDMPSKEEEEYIRREELDKDLKACREKQLKAIQQRERSAIASALRTTEQAGEEAMKLGFDAETARVLPLVPLIQAAWADGKITNAETKEILEKARAFGIDEDTAAHVFLTLLIQEQPTALFFTRVNDVIRLIVKENPSGDVGSNVLAWSKAVAEASGGFFGLKNPIHKKQQAVLDDLAGLLGVSDV
jgi:hypothetical protein